MPISLIPPRPGKTPYYAGRGTHFGQYVDRSTKTSNKSLARKIIKQWERDIESGQFIRPGEATFASASLAYMNAGGERRFLAPLLRHFGEKPLRQIDQAAIDEAATALYPDATTATKNRQVYSPVSAVLKRAGYETKLKRPKGSRGKVVTAWLTPEQAFRIFAAADTHDPEFGLLLRFLCYTGVRLSEGLRPKCEHVDLENQLVYISRTKNDNPRSAHLPDHLVIALANHPRGLNRNGERLFRFHKSGSLTYDLKATLAVAAGLPKPRRWKKGPRPEPQPEHELSWVNFHTFCHTWATWMRRYGGLDVKGLVETGRWESEQSASRYAHAVAGEASAKADLLPAPPTCGKPAEKAKKAS